MPARDGATYSGPSLAGDGGTVLRMKAAEGTEDYEGTRSPLWGPGGFLEEMPSSLGFEGFKSVSESVRVGVFVS